MLFNSEMNKNVCRKNKYGYCRYGDKYHFRHEKLICSDNNCSVFSCEKSYPRNCSWYQEYGQCKFTSYCKFKHSKKEVTNDIMESIRDNDNKLAKIEKQLESIEKEEVDIIKKFKAYANEVQKRMESVEVKLNEFWKSMEEKDIQISKLESVTEKLEKSIKEKNIWS